MISSSHGSMLARILQLESSSSSGGDMVRAAFDVFLDLQDVGDLVESLTMICNVHVDDDNNTGERDYGAVSDPTMMDEFMMLLDELDLDLKQK